MELKEITIGDLNFVCMLLFLYTYAAAMGFIFGRFVGIHILIVLIGVISFLHLFRLIQMKGGRNKWNKKH